MLDSMVIVLGDLVLVGNLAYRILLPLFVKEIEVEPKLNFVALLVKI